LSTFLSKFAEVLNERCSVDGPQPWFIFEIRASSGDVMTMIRGRFIKELTRFMSSFNERLQTFAEGFVVVSSSSIVQGIVDQMASAFPPTKPLHKVKTIEEARSVTKET
jgi:hypothetical protein